MKVLLLSPDRRGSGMPAFPLGLAHIAAGALGSHELRMLDLSLEAAPLDALRAEVASFDPDLVGISVRNLDSQYYFAPRSYLPAVKEAVDLLRAITAAPVLVGGAGFSLLPGPVLGYLGASFGLSGECETRFAFFLRLLAEGRPLACPGLWVPEGPAPAAPRLEELDAIGRPWRPAGLARRYFGTGPATVLGKRGCPYACTYCTTPLLEGRAFRLRSPQRIVDELESIRDEHGTRQFYFVDNNFNLPAAHGAAVCREILRRGLDVEWSGICNPAGLDEELAELMSRSGCREVSLGTDGGSGPALAGLAKPFDVAQIRHAVRSLRGAGIRAAAFLLLGGPGETEDTARESLDLMEELAPEAVRITIGIRLYPGTPLEALARGQGLVRPGEDFLQPVFYLDPRLGERLLERVRERLPKNPGWVLSGEPGPRPVKA